MLFLLTKQPENPQGYNPDGEHPMKPEQSFQDWVREAKAKGAVKFRLVDKGKKSQ